MPNGIPVWVTAIVQPVAIVIVIGVIVALLLWFAVTRIIDTVVYVTLTRNDEKIADQRKVLLDMEALHAEARAVILNVTAFEMDTTLPLKLRQQATGLRVAQLLYGYEQTVGTLREAYSELANARKKYASSATSDYKREFAWKPLIELLEPQVAMLEQLVTEMEPMLEQYGVAYEKLVRLRAV